MFHGTFFLYLDDPSLTVSELFLSGVGGTQLRRHLARKLKASQEMGDQDPALLWSTFFNQAVYTLVDLMYPCQLENVSILRIISLHCSQLHDNSKGFFPFQFVL